MIVPTRDYWAVWMAGMEWPSLYASFDAARNAAHLLAKQNVGDRVQLMKLGEIGSVWYPPTPTVTGQCVLIGSTQG